MYRFVLRRLFSGVLLLFVITTVAYLLLYAGGGDIARRIVGPTASDAQVALKASQLGLDRPLLVQYWDWLTSALTGDLGRSWFNGQLVSAGVSSRVSVTISLVLGATIIAAVVSWLWPSGRRSAAAGLTVWSSLWASSASPSRAS